MVKADRCWPRPQHVAWQYPHLNYSSMLAERSLHGCPSCLNSSTCRFPTINSFQGLAAPAIPCLKTMPTDEAQEFLQHPNSEPILKDKPTEGALINANPVSLQKKMLIFDHSGNKTRLFYGPSFPYVQSPIVTATKFAQTCDINEEGQTNNMGQKSLANCSLPEESERDQVLHEESEMHEDTEEINALLYSDDDNGNDDDDGDNDDDEVTSTYRSPLKTKRTFVIQEQFQEKEEVASSDWPNKRLKLVDGEYNRSPPPVDSASLVRLNQSCECVSDAESKYSSGLTYPVEKTKLGNPVEGDVQFNKDKIRESLRVLENLVPGLKGKEPISVIDGTIEFLKSLRSQVKYHLVASAHCHYNCSSTCLNS